MKKLELYSHPLASYCWKALIALYEADVPFTNRLVDLSDPAQRAALEAIWSVAKFPVLRDHERGVDVPESTIIVEYLADHGARWLVPEDHDAARRVRLWDRFFDHYVQTPMQKIVADHLRPEGVRDPHGVAEARAMLVASYAHLERAVTEQWLVGESVTLAECAAFPALFYADLLEEITQPRLLAYFTRLRQRPSIVRVLDEARPYFKNFPVPTRGPIAAW